MYGAEAKRQAGEAVRRRYHIRKRTLDIVISLAGLVALSPLMLAVSAAIVAETPGSGPIFAQTRIGKDGKPFTMYKFRSMYPGAETQLEGLLPHNEMDGPAFKMRRDPRVTTVGRFLRKTSMDELPQLWNVLRGDMSIVGPRPGLPREVAQYDDFARQRLEVQPGLTCYWQIQPEKNDLRFAQWMELDMKYIEERSLKTDWKIILATVGVVLGMDGI